MKGRLIAVFDVDAPLAFLHAGRLTAKRFKNSSSEKWMEKWFFAAETATYPSFIFSPPATWA